MSIIWPYSQWVFSPGGGGTLPSELLPVDPLLLSEDVRVSGGGEAERYPPVSAVDHALCGASAG